MNRMNMERDTEGDGSTRNRPTSYPSANLSATNPTLNSRESNLRCISLDMLKEGLGNRASA
jgi:hypothetical protein